MISPIKVKENGDKKSKSHDCQRNSQVYSYDKPFMKSATGMQTRIFFNITLVMGMRPGETTNLKLSKKCNEGEKARQMTALVGVQRCRSKN